MSLRNYQTIEERRKFIEKKTKVKFSAIAAYPPSLEVASQKNCENMIGAVCVPLGVAGPLRLKTPGLRAKTYYLPLATTEGALVASINRGCKAISLSGGAMVFTEYCGVTRGPVFLTSNLLESFHFKKWLETHFQDLDFIGRKTSSHLRLLKIDIQILGRQVFVRFYYETQDAMGMNMATFATEKIVQYIQEKTKVVCLSLAGNFDIDKKPAWLNFLAGRGRKVWAEVVLKEKVIKEVLKTTAAKIHQVVEKKCYLGSILSGSLGFNAHFANVIAALFIACGQDLAHVVEGSLGVTTTEIIAGNLYISIYLPDLVVGTVGGGTFLPSQEEALKILGIFGGEEGKNALQFAKIIGGAVLAGEISLLASLAEGSLASAHQSLARK